MTVPSLVIITTGPFDGVAWNGSNNIVVFLTIQYYCLSLRHE